MVWKDLQLVGLTLDRLEAIVGPDDFDLRIGIHIGDVLISGDQVIGDGVNVASRIQGLADPGAICISDRVYDDVRNHPELEARPMGKRALKNVNRRVMVYVLGGSPQDGQNRGFVHRVLVRAVLGRHHDRMSKQRGAEG